MRTIQGGLQIDDSQGVVWFNENKTGQCRLWVSRIPKKYLTQELIDVFWDDEHEKAWLEENLT